MQPRRAGEKGWAGGTQRGEQRKSQSRDRAGTRGPGTLGVLLIVNSGGRRGTTRRLRDSPLWCLPTKSGGREQEAGR